MALNWKAASHAQMKLSLKSMNNNVITQFLYSVIMLMYDALTHSCIVQKRAADTVAHSFHLSV